ncbi:flagellar biosynthesis anti-sigma factor FlgM [Pectobacteriaceae bacterium CE70]|uniref:flagellar biosynthesis anti-sigma factor FlgM n=1 Tax=Brenneria uluponensis TaxID=3057057 RepID=UPI0028E2D53E|nr:flagellar biosynthesis anti-sigma factor FlgM [Brenneria ulupoensis]WJV60954.1 flagellar biosynthesis anti-sigma factor FlgM [Pectobacteriaceae bacterium C52]WJV68593.1 flagellar biosynthesis anti-sigma factor FlgM [Pectobacteriaceae bacterium CE70]WJY12522.1 flagellar biosynthesis anti-sigma factor FlgM [Pectobacteriaceae bacterium C80]
MSIDSTRPVSGVNSIQSKETDHLQTSKSKSSTTSTSVESSQTQVSLSEAQSRLMQPSSQDIDMEKVENLKQAIKDGKLEVNVGKIADALINEAQSDI